MTDKGPSMFDTAASFAGITISVDPINRQRDEQHDNVMAMFYEEQPFMWEFVKDAIQKTITEIKGEIDFLDVGTGSGVWSILVAKNTAAKSIIAIDKSPRAATQAQANAEQNQVSFRIQEEFYNMNSAPYHSAKVIGIYAPYHLYPKEIEMKIPQHARGGVDGQQIFKEQLCTADYHLADNGIIVFNQMCLGVNGNPAFVEYIPQLIQDSSVAYTNIFPMTSTAEFLKGVYGDYYTQWQAEIAKQYPELYYCDGIITRNGKGTIEIVDHNIDLKGRTWTDRVELHQQIALHGIAANS